MQDRDDPQGHELAAAGGDALQIGDWWLQPSTHCLSRADVSHRLPKRLVDLLVCLASRPGQTWSREALIAAVWSRKVVNDEVLSRAVAELRGLLGDDARDPRYIETLPKTGYRLRAEVRSAGSMPDPGQPSAAPPPAAGKAVTAPPSRRARAAMLGLGLGLVLALLALLRWPWTAPAPSGAPAAAAPSGWRAADLAHERPFRSGPHWAWQPRHAADGRWLAYTVNDLDQGVGWLEWSAADGSSPRRLDTGAGRPAAPVFSPDGARIAFTAWQDGACMLRIIDLPAGSPRDLLPCGGSSSHPLDWPQPQRLLFTGPAAAGAASAIWQVDPDSGRGQPLTRPGAADVLDSHPRERGDGTLAFLRGPDGQRELWLRDADGERAAAPGGHRIPDLAWTGEQDGLLVASDRDGFPALHHFSIAGRSWRLLGARGAATLSLAADGSLLYERRRYDANVWLYGDGAPRRLTDSSRYEAFAAWSAAGDALLYVSNRDGNGSVWLQRDNVEQRLPLPPAEAWVRPQWLDPGSILLTRYEAGGATRIEVFDLATQRLRKNDPLSGPGFAAQPLGGHGILVGRGHGAREGMQLIIRHPRGERPLPQADGVAGFDSDGRWVAWTRRDDPRLFYLDLERDSSPRSLPGAAAAAAWTLHQGVLIYADRDAAGWALWRQPLDGGAPGRWLDLRAAPADGRIELDADGRRALVSHIDAFQSDLLQVPKPVDQRAEGRVLEKGSR